MRIAGLPPPLQQALLATLGRAADAVAASPGSDPAVAVPPSPLPAAAPVTQPATSVQMLVALAAAEPASERRRKQAVAAADRGLSLLERLHAELSVGTVSPARLRELVEWADAAEPPLDPGLATLQREVDLRVRVEVAKHDLRV